MKERLECGQCNRVWHRIDKRDIVNVPVPAHRKATVHRDSTDKEEWEPVLFEVCLALLSGPEVLDYDCPSCSTQVLAKR